MIKPEPSDSELLSRLASGDTNALRTIFDRYYTMLCGYAANILYRSDLVEEVVSNVFIDLWKHRKTRKIKALKAYLTGAVRNQAFNKIKQLSKENKAEQLMREDAETFTDHPRDKAETSKAFSDAVESLINDLSPMQRTVFCLSRIEEMPYKEIAEKLGISERTVQNHMVRAVKKVMPHLPRLKQYLRK